MRQNCSIVFFIIAVVCSLLSLESCASSETSLDDIGVSVIFEYSSEDSFPKQRISAFVEVASEVKKIKSISITYNDTGLKWIVEEPRLVSSSAKSINTKKYFAGYSQFRPEEKSFFPSGRYTFTAETYDGSIEELNFYVSYPSYLKTSRGIDIPSIINVKYDTYYAVYDDDSLIYYGEELEDWSNKNNILKNYENAKYCRICYKFNGNVICMMPPIVLGS